MDYISVLDNAVLDMMNTQIILADKSVKKVLVAISKCEDYCRTIKECASGFDFEKEFTRCFSPKTEPPKSPRALIALIAAVLFKIDSGKLNFLDFLKATYPDIETTESYPKFISEYIIPFVDALNMLTFGQPYEEVSAPQMGSYDKLKEEITWAVNRLIREQLSVGDDVSDEVLTMLNGLAYSISTRDNMIIKIAYIGLENTLYRHRINLGDNLADIKSILTVYGVI
ncbi:MAG TPA: hypothetical protein PKY53_00620 [Clostridia bacterium]|jgi:hypothetical protein|nr:hypothetical protein [Clostridia bacterium]